MEIKFTPDEWIIIHQYSLCSEQRISDLQNLDIQIVENIREKAIIQQQLIGFDENYDLTKTGRILQSIIDKSTY